MTTTNVTSFGHSTVALERAGSRLVIDPGVLAPEVALSGAQLVLITHEHADHVAVPRVVAAAFADETLQVWAPATVIAALTEAGVSAEQLRVAAPGDSFEAAGFAVSVHGGDHAVIHPAFPHAANVAYLIDGFALHPGDSFTMAPEGVDVELLFLPISAPWMTLGGAIDYLAATAPKIAVPIHDGILSEAGKMLIDQMVGAARGQVEYRRSPVGEAFAVESA